MPPPAEGLEDPPSRRETNSSGSWRRLPSGARFARAPIPAFPRKRGKGPTAPSLPASGGRNQPRLPLLVGRARRSPGPGPLLPPPLAGEGWGGGHRSREPRRSRHRLAPIPAFPRERGRGKERGSPRQRRLPDLPDLVAHPRRVLELQVAGVLVHLLFQGLEPGGELRRIQRGVVLGLVGHTPGPAGGGAGRGWLVAGALHDVHHRTHHRLRGDAVLGVVLDLLLPTA